MSMKIKKGDMVSVVSGKDKGKSGKVTKVLTKKSKAFVEGINLVKVRGRNFGKKILKVNK